MKLLILATDYPNNNGKVSLYYIHTRNKYYKSKGIDLTVINFNSSEDYVIDGIPVYSMDYFKNNLANEKYDILVCHSPNIRNHYRFLKKYEHMYEKIVFIFHGHEVLRCSKVYPKPYSFVKQEKYLKMKGKDYYDIVKLLIWKRAFERLVYKSWFVFVSEWMYEEFIKWVKIDPLIIRDKKRIIYNSIGEKFEKEVYDENIEKEYDFITIRSFLDGSKYCIDVVTNIAKKNPQYKFCIAGRGEYFKVNEKPENIILIDKYLNHNEIIQLLNKSKCALLPTRTDAQGVMACEVATFGIPLITSNISVCKEVFDDFNNVEFIDNSDYNIDIGLIKENIKYKRKISDKYHPQKTTEKEIELYNEILIGVDK